MLLEGTPQPVVGRNKKAATFQRLLCDPGEARTLDPMIKSHLLYQLSYGVNVLLISVAKVMPFFYPTKFSGYFFSKKIELRMPTFYQTATYFFDSEEP